MYNVGKGVARGCADVRHISYGEQRDILPYLVLGDRGKRGGAMAFVRGPLPSWRVLGT